jgi:hypothetical protein
MQWRQDEMRGLAARFFTIGAALFAVIFLILRLTTRLSPSIILGLELLIIFLWGLVRTFVGPVATHPRWRNAQILRTLSIGLICLSTFFNAWSTTSTYAPWILAGGVLFYLGVSKPYTRKILADGTAFKAE